MANASELPIDVNASAMDMANTMFGDGVTILSADYSGAKAASGTYSDGDAVAPGATPGDTGVILSTGRAKDFTNSSGDANVKSSTTTNWGRAGDSDLDAIAGAKTYDAAVFESTFVPQGSTLTMQVQFSSEEYLEYVGSGFNDAVGIYVNGEKAELTVGDGDITINNINDESNENLYIDNPANADEMNTEMDGLTVTLTLKAPVTPGQANTIKIAIADGGDGAYDSNLMIAGNSIQSALVAGDDAVDLHGDSTKTVDVLDNDVSATGSTLTITHINGQPVSAGDTITLATGETVTLEPDGQLTFAGAGEEGSNVLTYTVSDTAGHTDVGFISLTTTPCFVAGTHISTPSGPRKVDDLRAGDPVVTRDHGVQILRWSGRAVRRADGADAPVEIVKGAFGAHRTTYVSPQHRLLVCEGRAQLLFDSPEVLVRAKHLVDGQAVRLGASGARVTYIHLLFDQHEILCADGVWSESYQPGDQSLGGLNAPVRDELFRLFPSLRSGTGVYGPAARPALKSFEARLMRA